MFLAYARVSTEDQASPEATSLDEQKRKTRAVASLHGCSEYDFVDYVDPGVSGTTPLSSRPAGRRMLEEAKAGDTIVVAKLDRLFRSARDALETTEKLAKRKIDVIMLDMGTQPVTSDGISRLFFTMIAAFAEFERRLIAERMNDGRKGKAAKGGHIGGDAPYGYNVQGRGRLAKLVENPDERKIVDRIMVMVRETRVDANGREVRVHTDYSIARVLAREEIYTRKGTDFLPWQITRIIRREEQMMETAAAKDVEEEARV